MGQVNLEDILEKTGGCGRYQVILAIIVHSMKTVVCFSMMFMVFGAAKPDWWCADDFEGLQITYKIDMAQYKSCTSTNGTAKCTMFVFDDSMKTIISEWDLVCDKAWIPSTITSIQMAGVFVGNLACGQVADLIGRKPPLFLSVLSLVVSNGIAALSTSWRMFAILRFCIGLGIGFELTVQYNLMSEFTLARWRAWVVAVPSWSTQILLFALVSWLLKDWQYIHVATLAIGLPLLATYWFVPESFRWYVGHDRIQDAENVIKNVARINKKPVPDMMELREMNVSMEKAKTSDKRYSFFDLAKDKKLLKYTLLLACAWMSLGLGTYGIQFGVPDLSGNLYVNMFVPSLIGSPVQMLIIYLENRFGRKKTSILFYVLCSVTAFIVAVAHRFQETSVRNYVTNVAALLSLTAMNVSWTPIQTLTIETYPTVVRSLGFGLQNTMARIGAIIGPQLVFLETSVSGIMYWICGVTSLLSVFSILPIPETKEADLTDKIHDNKPRNQANEDVEIKIVATENGNLL